MQNAQIDVLLPLQKTSENQKITVETYIEPGNELRYQRAITVLAEIMRIAITEPDAENEKSQETPMAEIDDTVLTI